MRIILLGAPGSGKGTQGERLAAHFGAVHISTGDILRSEVASGSPLGRQVSGYVAAGELVPDEVMLAVLAETIRLAVDKGGYVLDGFPRSLHQAEFAFAQAEVAGATADAVVFLSVPDEEARTRLAGRASLGRLDDQDESVIATRLKVFHAETEPLLEFYRQRGILVTVDATGDPDDVAAALIGSLSGVGR